jgi:hypothetical protein
MPGRSKGRDEPIGVIVSSASAGFEPATENEGPKGNGSRQQKEPRARRHGHKRYPLHAEDNERNGSDSAGQGIGSKGLNQDHGKGCSSALPLKVSACHGDSLSTPLIPAVILLATLKAARWVAF